ncbi:MAG: DNA polymerase I [Deferribacteraceae bacterium]|nr:DNA polymerase I [Deferribacteraceae bacterium]
MIVILDGNSIAYRAFHKAPDLSAPDGTPTGAVHIFFTILERVRTKLKPTQIIAVFDASGPTTRHEQYPEYKANREAMPEALATQMLTIRELLPLAGVPVYRKTGIEADDIIATLARKSAEPVTIVTKDKDLFQLVNENIKIYDDQTGKQLGEEETKTKYGVKPTEMLSYLSLIGDKSDNIPGVTGVGEKTACKLIQDYSSLDGIYANIDTQKGKLKENLLRDKESAYRAMSLIALQDVTLFEPELARDPNQLRERLSALGMRTVAFSLLSAMGEVEAAAAAEVVLDLPIYNLGEVKTPTLAVALDGEYWVTDENRYEHFEENRHDISKAAFYDVKAFAKLLGHECGIIRDYLLISWLCEPDNGTIRKAKTESMEQFIPRVAYFAKTLDQKLAELGLEELYSAIELPAAYALAKAELAGIKLDTAQVRSVSNVLKQHISIVATRIMNRAGFEINLNSPKQLSDYIYSTLGIKPLSKTKLSTAEDVLKELMTTNEEHREVLEDILTYREYSKLLSTYTQPLLDAMGADGRVHTTFKQTGTGTGRLSSIAPNLQNIPARGEIGKTIRKAFVPAEGYVLATFDYSQIELRVLAHLSGDPALKEAFASGQDIHSITAKKIFNLEAVDADHRRLAKAVNFGIIYGLSPYGLSRDTGVTPREAKEFINAYFALYSNIKSFIDSTIENTRKNGYCETVLGRKRFFADINSRNGMMRSRAERAAMNAPIQGSAADIIKLAMLKCDKMITERGFDARLLLQIHDELLFEVRQDIVDSFMPAVHQEMEAAFALNVPLIVNGEVGMSWGELK